jgi:hypothetical protein
MIMKYVKKIVPAVLAASLILGGLHILASDDNGDDGIVFVGGRQPIFSDDENYYYYDGKGDEGFDWDLGWAEEASMMDTIFTSMTGRVIEITEHDHSVWLRIENDYTMTDFIIDINTMKLGEMPEMGDEITAFYDANMPRITIFPYQVNARAIVGDLGENGNVRLARFAYSAEFGGQLISSEGDFILNFTDDTPIYFQDGQNFREVIEGDIMEALQNRLLLVEYSAINRMMPPATVPGEDGQNVRIHVLFEQAVHLGFLGLDTGMDFEMPEYGINVSGRFINEKFQWIDDTVYVPFRAVLAELGMNDSITWHPNTATISFIGHDDRYLQFAPGSDRVEVNGEMKTLDFKTLLIEGVTYVPLHMFRGEFLGFNNAYWFEGMVNINNFELMQ